jgi:hypothetical protein
MPNGVNGITDADVTDRLKIAAALVKEALRARQQAMALAQEATTDEQQVSDIISEVFKAPPIAAGGIDVGPDEIHRILGAAVNGALETWRAAEKVNQSVLHPAPGALNVQMMFAAAEAAFRNGDLLRAYSQAGVAIRGCEDAIAALDAVKTAEGAVDRALSEAKALGH